MKIRKKDKPKEVKRVCCEELRLPTMKEYLLVETRRKQRPQGKETAERG